MRTHAVRPYNLTLYGHIACVCPNQMTKPNAYMPMSSTYTRIDCTMLVAVRRCWDE